MTLSEIVTAKRSAPIFARQSGGFWLFLAVLLWLAHALTYLLDELGHSFTAWISVFPTHGMTAMPAVIVLVYLFSIIVMTLRTIPVASAAVV